MKILTRSRRIKSALQTVTKRLPGEARKTVEGFLDRVIASREWRSLGLGGFDPSSAVTAPLFRSLDDLGSERYTCQLIFHLPVVKLFSNTALIGIVAHELAHVHIAAGLGDGWHEEMKQHEPAHERRADRPAARWGFAAEIARLHEERRKTVNPILDRREPVILRRISERFEAEEQEARKRSGATSEDSNRRSS